MKWVLGICIAMFGVPCYAQHAIEIQHGKSTFYLETVVDHALEGDVIYHEPLFFFLQNTDHSGVFYKRREVDGPNDSISFYLLLSHSFLKEKVAQDPMFEGVDQSNIRQIPLKRVLIRFLNVENGKIYEVLIGNPNEFLITNDILQANIQIPDHDIGSMIQAINHGAFEMTAFYIYPATKYEYQKINVNHKFFFSEKIIKEIFGDQKTVYVTESQLEKIFINVDQTINVFGYFENIVPSQSTIPRISLEVKKHFPKIHKDQVSQRNISQIYNKSDQESSNTDYLYRLDRESIGTVTEEFVRQAPRFNYIAKGIAYREAGMHSAKIPFSDHSIFDKYQGFLPRESSCSYKTSDLPKQCKSITVSKNKSGEIVLKNKSGSYKTPQSESSNIQVFLSKDAINLKNDTIEYFHEFVFNPDLWAITVFKNNEIIAKVTRKNFYLYDPLANRKKIKDSYISKVECDFASVSYIVKDKVLKIRDCEGDNEIASYY